MEGKHHRKRGCERRPGKKLEVGTAGREGEKGKLRFHPKPQRRRNCSRGPGQPPPGPQRPFRLEASWSARFMIHRSAVSFYFQVKNNNNRITIWFLRQLLFLSGSLGP